MQNIIEKTSKRVLTLTQPYDKMSLTNNKEVILK